MDVHAGELARATRPARHRESQAAQHAGRDLSDIAQPHDADPFVERRVRLLERVPTGGSLCGGEPLAVAQDRQRRQADIFAHGLRRFFARHAHDRHTARQVGVAGDVIDAGRTAEDHAQMAIARQPPGLGLPDQDMGDGIGIDRGIVPSTHFQSRRQLGEARLPLRQGGRTTGLHQQQAAVHHVGKVTNRAARRGPPEESPCCA